MRISRPPHNWRVSPGKAKEIQKELARRVCTREERPSYRLAAGVDAAFSTEDSYCFGAVVLWNIKESAVREQHTARADIAFPYIPGLLSFREAPVIIKALRRLKEEPDILICDGQGIAHQRRLGIASHLGVLTGLPSIGCAKSRLIGDYQTPGPAKGAGSPLTDRGERIGTVLRSRRGVKPVFVSVGHNISLRDAEETVLACCRKYRLPEPIRLADHLCTAAKKMQGVKK
ncbi:MAG: deoxyribonuclease V [Desulfurivibrionaceae bacterium]